MSDHICIICSDDEDEVEEMIGISFNKLDHPDKDDIFLCSDCIDSAQRILEEKRFKNKVVEVIKLLNEE
ncbi:MAG: hypothetical protein ACFFG0_00855 [Candidatus Thorarchaeota archaeon]